MILIDRKNAAPFYQQIHDQVIQGIEGGAYRTGDRLPSIRSFALELGVSRNTVEQAYLLLVQEGYANARQGSGYYINSADIPQAVERHADPVLERALLQLKAMDGNDAESPVKYDFSRIGIEPGSFPFYRWIQVSRDVMLDAQRDGACKPTDPRGLEAFREQIARYLLKERGIAISSDQIAVFPSSITAMAAAFRMLAEEGYTAIFNNPCRPETLAAFRDSGIPATPIATYAKEMHGGSQLAGSLRNCIRYTTPENRFPFRRIMPVEERKRLVSWAVETDSYLLDDGYCHEFQYRNPRLPSLYTLDTHGRVISVGTFEESLSPSMGPAYLVLPPQLMIRWLNRATAPLPVSWHTQAAIAEFMKRNHWNPHLRRLQTSCRHKHDAVLRAIETHMGDAVDYSPSESGLHVLLRTKDTRSESELVRLAAQAGIRVYPTSVCWSGHVPANWNRILLGFASMPLEHIETGIAELAHAWFA